MKRDEFFYPTAMVRDICPTCKDMVWLWYQVAKVDVNGVTVSPDWRGGCVREYKERKRRASGAN